MFAATVTSVAAFACAPAVAATTYDFTTYLRDGGGSISVSRVAPAVSIRVTVSSAGGDERFSATGTAVEGAFDAAPIDGLATGDVVKVWQPADAAAPTETYEIPGASVGASPGEIQVTIPAAHTGSVSTDLTCERPGENFDALVAGAQVIPFAHYFPGAKLTLIAHSSAGDTLVVTNAGAGQTPCFSAQLGGTAISVGHLSGAPADDSRLVLRRSGDVVAQADGAGAGAYLDSPSVVQAGDVLELEQPAGGPVTASVTVPAVIAEFNTATDVVSVDGPASGAIRVSPQVGHGVNFRLARDLPAGDSNFDFSSPEDAFPALDLASTAGVDVTWVNPAHTLELALTAARTDPTTQPQLPAIDQPPTLVAAAARDTTPPKARISLPKAAHRRSGRIARSGLRVGLKLDESAACLLTLAVRSRSRNRTAEIARARRSLGPGGHLITLRPSARGHELLRSAVKSQKASLRVSCRDASGNLGNSELAFRVNPKRP